MARAYTLGSGQGHYVPIGGYCPVEHPLFYQGQVLALILVEGLDHVRLG